MDEDFSNLKQLNRLAKTIFGFMKQFPLNYKGWYEKSIESFWVGQKTMLDLKCLFLNLRGKFWLPRHIYVYI